MEKDFELWNIRKQAIDSGKRRIFCHPREIWWCTLGVNVGFEQDGIGPNFRRPVIVVRGFSKDAFLGVPLTSQKKQGKYYFPIGMVGGEIAVAILSQVRFIDTKRLTEKIDVLDDGTFQKMKSALCRTLFDDCWPPLSRWRGRSPCCPFIIPPPNSLSNIPTKSYNNPMNIRIKRFEKDLPLPEYQTAGAAGFDLRARATVTIAAHAVGYVPLNVAIETPPDHFLLIATRGSTHKRGLMLANSVGIGDSDFCGDDDEYQAALLNFTDAPVTVERGDRIAQGIFIPFTRGEWEEVEKMQNKTRGGFGSTGKK